MRPQHIIKISILILTLLLGEAHAMEEEDYVDTSNIDKELTNNSSILDRLFKRDERDSSSTQADNEQEIEITVQELDRSDVKHNIAVIRIIDKTLGKQYLIDLEVGTKKALNEITIKAHSCWRPTQKLILPEGRALIEVYETKSRIIEKIFNGWVYAQSPSVSQLSHPKYDITLAGCKTAQAVASVEEEVN